MKPLEITMICPIGSERSRKSMLFSMSPRRQLVLRFAFYFIFIFFYTENFFLLPRHVERFNLFYLNQSIYLLLMQKISFPSHFGEFYFFFIVIRSEEE